MSLRGYSFRLVRANQAADTKKIGVQLGRYCIAKDIPVAEIAEKFDVSRMTIYSWFTGVVRAIPGNFYRSENHKQKPQVHCGNSH